MQRIPNGQGASLVLQAPNILLVGIILWLLHRWADLPLGWTLALFGLWLLMDLAMLILLRDVPVPPRAGPETLEGARAVVREPLAPRGHVRIGGEIWQAESLQPWESIPPGPPPSESGRDPLRPECTDAPP